MNPLSRRSSHTTIQTIVRSAGHRILSTLALCLPLPLGNRLTKCRATHSPSMVRPAKGLIVVTISPELCHHFSAALAGRSYNWPVSDRTWDKLDTGFDPANFPDSGEQNTQLKEHISQCWARADENEKSRLALWIISDWGGIKTNKPSTIEGHVALADQAEPETPLEGVASYSKVLAFANPNKYAIYDARVAAALNAIQMLFTCEGRLAFPYVLGRNTKIQGTKDQPGFVRLVPKRVLVSMGFMPVKRREAYKTYLQLIDGILRCGFGDKPGDVEMMLFSDAEYFCRQALSEI